MQAAQPTFTSVSITVKLVAIIAGTRVTSNWVMAVVVATSIVTEALVNVWMCDRKGWVCFISDWKFSHTILWCNFKFYFERGADLGGGLLASHTIHPPFQNNCVLVLCNDYAYFMPLLHKTITKITIIVQQGDMKITSFECNCYTYQ